MFTNITPYIGKLRLVIERNPYHTGKDKLNKVHLDLGFTKLVSRITPDKKDGVWQVKPSCIKLIEEHTGLKVVTYSFGPNLEYELPNSCMNPDNEYVGSIEEGWWYYINGLRSIKKTHPHTAWGKEAKQWIGYSHRASCAFGKGDKLFDPNWTPSDDELLQYEKYYVKHLNDYEDELERWENSTSEHKETEENMSLNRWATSYIPFKLRGSKTIHSYEDAYEAALAFAKYVS